VHHLHELAGFFGLQWLEDLLFYQMVDDNQHVAVHTTVQRAWREVFSKVHGNIKPLSLRDR
jgi:hypothetical protein